MRKEKWTAKLPDGRQVEYKWRQLLSGRFKLMARELGTGVEHVRIVGCLVKLKDIETIFRSALKSPGAEPSPDSLAP